MFFCHLELICLTKLCKVLKSAYRIVKYINSAMSDFFTCIYVCDSVSAVIHYITKCERMSTLIIFVLLSNLKLCNLTYKYAWSWSCLSINVLIFAFVCYTSTSKLLKQCNVIILSFCVCTIIVK